VPGVRGDSRDNAAFVRLRVALAAARRDGASFADVWPGAVDAANFTPKGRAGAI
jgi:hypothetical protein